MHGRAVPETGRVSIVEHDKTVNREFVWEPIAAGDWTFLGGSAFDSGFRHDLKKIREIRQPAQEGTGLRYIVIQVKNCMTSEIDLVRQYIDSKYTISFYISSVLCATGQ